MGVKMHIRRLRTKLRRLFHRQPKLDLAETHPSENAPARDAEKSPEKPPPPQYQTEVNVRSANPNLWQRAEDTLNSNRDKQQLLRAVYETLAEELGEELQPIGTAGRQAQLDRLFQKRVNALEKQKWKIQFGDQSVAVQDLVNGLFEKVLVVKGLVDTAASASPPAALACAGLSVVFMLALQATSQQAILLQTLDYTSSLMCRFQVMEDVYRSRENASDSPPGHRADLLQRFEDHLTDLYAAILEFQARAMHYLGKRSVVRLLSDAFEHEGWDGILQNIKSLEVSTEKDAQIIGAANVDQQLKAIQTTQQYESTRQMLIDRDEKAMKLLRALYTCPYKDRKDRNDQRVPGTCEWFTHHSLFEQWHKTEGSGLLWVSADPGCGKSVLARYLVDDFLPARKEATICYFFFKDDFSDQNTAVNALSAILRQIFLSNPQLLRESILVKFGTDGDRLTKSFDDLWAIFTSVVDDPNFGEVICILDALDECEEVGRSRLIEGVVRAHQGGLGTGNVKFLVTSRPYVEIYRVFQGVQEDLSMIHLSGEDEQETDQISKEINLVTQKRVEDIARERDLTSKQCQMLLDELMLVANRTYLWVTLTMDVIRTTPSLTKGNIRAVMSQLPSTVDDAYEKILSRSPAPERAKAILHTILAAERPLSVSEMALVVACNQAFRESVDIEDYLESAEDFKQALRQICGLFVVVIHSQVYLLHQTAREFLVQSKSTPPLGAMARTSTWKGSINLQDSNRLLAEVCVRYIAAGKHRELNTLEEYARIYWATHFSSCTITYEDPITPLARQLCPSDCHVALKFAFRSDLPSVVEYLIKVEKAGVGPPSLTGRTFLASRAEEGRADLVQMILEHAIDVTSGSDAWIIPLRLAVINGHVQVVRVFLESGVDLISENGLSDTSICYAAFEGNTEILDLLLSHGADVNTRDLLGRTLLSLAEGHEAACRLLISCGAEDV